MKPRIFFCHYDYLPYPPSRTFQVGWVFLSRHFPGCDCWSADISTHRAIASFPSFYAMGDGWKAIPFRSAILARWKQITFHLGPLVLTVCLNQANADRQVKHLNRAAV